jgi:predicted NBD/HSP70 family sugar kinase
MMLVKVGHGVGSGLLLGGVQFFGSHSAAGEIGHVVVDPSGEACGCGRSGCLETWLAAPRLAARLKATTTSGARDAVLHDAGHRLGVVLAPIAGALDLAEIVLSGPVGYFGDALVAATAHTLAERTMTGAGLALRVSELGDDIVLRGAAAAVLSKQLGFS